MVVLEKEITHKPTHSLCKWILFHGLIAKHQPPPTWQHQPLEAANVIPRSIATRHPCQEP